MKKALCLLLSAVMIISVMAGVDLSAYAQSANEDAVQTCIITNPYYNDIVEEAAVTSQINDDIDNEASTFCYSAPAMRSTVYTADNAAKVLRDKMVARTESVSINVLTPLTNVSEIANEIFWKAVSQEFSESSVDGDYLMWHWSYVYAAGVPITMGSKNNEFLLQFELDYYSTAAQEKKVTEKVNSVLKELNLDGKSDYRKIRLIHNFVCETAKYDYEHYENDSYKVQFTTYGALIGGYAVCQGYASLFYRLCTESGVS
ncbi:MAG: transglutaminase domain-containing protein, partial [Eubacterium sp.]